LECKQKFTINATKSIGWESERIIQQYTGAYGVQAELVITEYLKTQAWETKADKLIHLVREKYLEPDATGGYGTDTEDTEGYNAILGSQFSGTITGPHSVGWQVQKVISATKSVGWQVEAIIDKVRAYAFQALFTTVETLGMQFRAVIYNTTQLRILADFPSRGTTGTNWTATSTETGDFDINNVNTDIVEQVYRSVAGVTSVTLDCDTEIPQGVFLDTLAILNHNISKNATVSLVGSSNPGHSPAGTTIPLTPTLTDMYYIAPDLPLTGYRYWRIVIDDPGNDYIQIGTIVFGEAIIFSVNQSFANPITKQKVNYVDTVFTEGHTNVSNDRGVKKKVKLDFKDLNFDSDDYTKLQDVFEAARTLLKTLWIPTPGKPDRFGIFAKMTGIPDESHNDVGEAGNYVDLSVELDESR
jgi:hypothetical protein